MALSIKVMLYALPQLPSHSCPSLPLIGLFKHGIRPKSINRADILLLSFPFFHTWYPYHHLHTHSLCQFTSGDPFHVSLPAGPVHHHLHPTFHFVSSEDRSSLWNSYAQRESLRFLLGFKAHILALINALGCGTKFNKISVAISIKPQHPPRLKLARCTWWAIIKLYPSTDACSCSCSPHGTAKCA
jgi:hypothetical protein